MNTLLCLIPLVIVIILLIIFKIKCGNPLDYGIKMIFLGICSIFVTAIITGILGILLPNLAHPGAVRPLLNIILFGALAEEASKLSMVAASKPKNNQLLIVNAILIGSIFSLYEDLLYTGDVISQATTIGRLITPGHAFYLLIPIWFIILGRKTNKKVICTIIGIIFGMAVHTLYNVFNTSLVLCIIWGIIGYAAIIFSLYKASKMESIQEEIKNKALRIIIRIIEAIIIIGFTLIVLITNKTDTYKIGSTCENQNTHLKVTLISVEEDIDQFSNDKLAKVKFKVENTSKEAVKTTVYDYFLYDSSTDRQIRSTFGNGESIDIIDEIPAETSVTGYLYYKIDKDINKYVFINQQLTQNNGRCVFELK